MTHLRYQKVGTTFCYGKVMRSADTDLARLFHLSRLLKEEKVSLGRRVELIYEYLFENEDLRGRKLSLSPVEGWDDGSLDRAFSLLEEIVTQYTRYFYDPSLLPVTYYKRQRRVAGHLDQELSAILRERVRRKGEEVPQDLYLTEPIYAFKQEARTKAYPKSKDGRISLRILRERFHTKMIDKRVA